MFQHQLISTCKTINIAWDILQSTFEADNTVKHSKLHKLTSDFEILKMHEHETISEFNSRILPMVNDFFAIGKIISEEEIYRKILTSTYPRYHPKILAIKEYANMSAMTKGSLIGKLMVYKTNYLNLNPKKEKCIAFQVEIEAPVTKSSEDDNSYLYVDNSLAFIAKNFKKMLKKTTLTNQRRLLYQWVLRLKNVRLTLILNYLILTNLRVFDLENVEAEDTYKHNMLILL